MRGHVHVHVRTRVRVRVCACGCWTNIRLVHCFFSKHGQAYATSVEEHNPAHSSEHQTIPPNLRNRDTNAPLRDSNAPLRDANDPLTLLITCRCACALGHAHPAFHLLCISRISSLCGSYTAHAHRGGILNAAMCSHTLCMQSGCRACRQDGVYPVGEQIRFCFC